MIHSKVLCTVLDLIVLLLMELQETRLQVLDTLTRLRMLWNLLPHLGLEVLH